MLVSFHLVVTFLIAVDLSELNSAVALIYRSHCKVMSLAELLGGVLLPSGSSNAVSLFWMSHHYFHVVTQWSIRVWTSMLHQSCSTYFGTWVTFWAWISALAPCRDPCRFAEVLEQALCIKASGDKQWVLFPLPSSRSCQTALKTSSIRKYSKHCESQVLYLL